MSSGLLPSHAEGQTKKNSQFIRRITKCYPAHSKILEYLRNKRPTSFTKIYSPTQIADRIKEFKQRLLKKFNNALPELYFMKFDVKSCYDSIPRMECMRILKDALKMKMGFSLDLNISSIPIQVY